MPNFYIHVCHLQEFRTLSPAYTWDVHITFLHYYSFTFLYYYYIYIILCIIL